MEKYKRYLELRIRTIKKNLEACKRLEEAAQQPALAAYQSKLYARLSEVEMGLEYWKYMEDA